MVHWAPQEHWDRTDLLIWYLQENPNKQCLLFGDKNKGSHPATGGGKQNNHIYAEMAEYIFTRDTDTVMQAEYILTCKNTNCWAGIVERCVRE